MEKSHLLNELAQLKRLLREHEMLKKSCNSQNATQKSSSSLLGKTDKSTLETVEDRPNPPSHSYNVIYVNPNKIGLNIAKSEVNSNIASSIAIKRQKETLDSSYDHKMIKRSSVFINPNFRKSISHHQGGISCSEQNDTKYKNVQNMSVPSHSESKLNKSLVRVPESKRANLSSMNKKIFVNPQFNLPENTTFKSKSVVNSSVIKEPLYITSSTRNALNTNSEGHHLESKQKKLLSANLKITQNQSSSNSMKRKIDQRSQSLERSLVQYKRVKTKGTNQEECGKTILINPSFQNELNTTINADKNDSMGVDKFSAASQPSTSANPGQIFNDLSALVNRNNRRRLSSSVLVSVSSTKLIRKRKLSQGSSRRKSLKKTPPIFLSKNKLVRNNTTNCIKNNSSLLNKTLVKRVVPKTHLNLLGADKIKRLRRQSLTNSITNLINVVPTSTAVTKVKSKNGRSLKLLRKPLDSSVLLRVKSGDGKSLKLIRNPDDLTTVTKIRSKNGKTLNLIRKTKDPNKVLNEKYYIKKNMEQRQRQVHIQQASRRAQYFIQNKWRQNQFSKINVPSTGKLLANRNKYVFERNKSLTKNTLSTFKLETRQALANKNSCKLVSSNVKSQRSKYKFIRKSICDPDNASKHCNKRSINLGMKSSPPTSNKKKWKRRKKVSRTSQRKQLSIVNIGGVFYRCTRTSLCRNKTSSGKDEHNKGPLLKIRGQKFQFDDNGLTLKCLDSKPGRKRIDIGGMTFISSASGNSLTRTNYHTDRSILTQAKHKSLSVLVNKWRKNNEPCPFYHRFGRCTGKERGTCIRQHDPKFVAVCKKFVAGTCNDAQCLLSHVTSVHNMPTCQHYLAGQCTRDPCPYLHVKLSDSAPLCIDFLKGFCSLGDQCNRRHLELCPSFEKGACPRGKYCPYPHPKSSQKLKGHFQKKRYVKKKPPPPLPQQEAVSSNVRYFEDIQLQEENKIQLIEEEETEDLCSEERSSEGEDNVHRLKNRPKLGRLPSYIPLSMDQSCPESGSERDCASSH